LISVSETTEESTLIKLRLRWASVVGRSSARFV